MNVGGNVYILFWDILIEKIINKFGFFFNFVIKINLDLNMLKLLLFNIQLIVNNNNNNVLKVEEEVEVEDIIMMIIIIIIIIMKLNEEF